jgi:hypothetical protein
VVTGRTTGNGQKASSHQSGRRGPVRHDPKGTTTPQTTRMTSALLPMVRVPARAPLSTALSFPWGGLPDSRSWRGLDGGRAALCRWHTFFRTSHSFELYSTPLIADSDRANPLGLWIGGRGDGWVVGQRCREDDQGLWCDRGAIWPVGGAKGELVRLEPAPAPLDAVWGWPGGAVAVGERNTVMVFDGSTWKTAP